jgi:choline-sulfatase
VARRRPRPQGDDRVHMKVKRRSRCVRKAAWAAACLLFIAGCERDSPHQGPNVLLITLDTTRADHLSCYGYPEPTSENLDQLAAEGVLFTRAVTQAAVTPVSHASILTGQNPYNHGLRVMHGLEQNRLRDSCTTLAEVLRDAGYRTAAFVSAFPVTERFGLQQGFETFDADFVVDDTAVIVSAEGVVNTGKNQRRADETTDRALAWLTGTGKPFFLWVHYFDPHDPQLRPPSEFIQAYPLPLSPLPDRLRALYDVEIRYMDRQLGRLLADLRQSGRFDDTIVVVVADHGEGLGDHDWWTHGILYQEQIHAPLIIRAPSVPAGKKIDYLVRTIDIMPTVLELAGIRGESSPPMDGASLVPLLAGEAADPGYLAYADSVDMLTYGTAAGTRDEKDDILFGVTDGTWKYIHHALRPGEGELYNLQEDPGERTNLYASHPEQVKRLLSDLRRRDCVPREPLGGERMSPADLERLRSLGYILETQPTRRDDD